MRFQDSNRRDPFRNFNFKIVMGGVEVAACRKMSGLEASVNVVKFRAGNDKTTVDHVMPGRVEYMPITFESGVTNDTAFTDWANALIKNEWSTGGRAGEPDFRREVEVHVFDVDGALAKKFVLHNAWVSKFTALSELAGDGNDVLIETLEVVHEGFTSEQVAGGGGDAEEEEA